MAEKVYNFVVLIGCTLLMSLITVAPVVYFGSTLVKYIRLLRKGYVAEGRLAYKERRNVGRYGSRLVYADYETPDGSTVTAQLIIPTLIIFREGKPITLVYDPKEPQRAYAKGFQTVFPLLFLIAVFCYITCALADHILHP